MTSVIIRLQNLPMSANASNIRRFFVGLNIPEGGVHIVGGADGDAFIAFSTDEDARKAMLLDRQAINSTTIRLFLSSKTEMQSVIESARSSVMVMPHVVPQLVTQTSSVQREQYHANVSNGVDNFSSHLNKPDAYSTYNYQQKPGIPEGSIRFNAPLQNAVHQGHFHKQQPTDSASFLEADNFSYNIAQWNNAPDNHIIHTTPKPHTPEIRKEVVSKSQPYTDFRSQAPPTSDIVSHIEGDFQTIHPLIPPKEQEAEHTFPGYKRAFMDTRSTELYQGPTAKLSGSDLSSNDYAYGQSYNAQPYDNIQYNSGDYDINKSLCQIDNNRVPLNNQQWDFSVRPPWLNENNSQFPKPQVQLDESIISEEDVPFKRNRVDKPPHEPSLDTNFVVKISFCPQDVSIQAVFEILHGVNVIPRWGIRIEEDAIRRPTGYVYIMLNGREALERALNQNGSNYHGQTVSVTSSSPNEFFRVTDSNFQSKCPPSLIPKIVPKSATKPLFFSDGCMELGDLPYDVTASEVVAFLGAPGLTPSDVKLTDAGARNQVGVRAVVRLPSSKDLDILLSAQPRPFRGTQGQSVRLNAISKMQFDFSSDKTISSFDKREISNTVKDIEQVHDFIPKTVLATSQIPSDAKTCAFIYGFVRSMNDYEILKLFPSLITPPESINLVSNNKAALMNFGTEVNCKKALTDFSNSESKLKEIHFNLAMRGITHSDFDRRLNELTNEKPDHGTSPQHAVQPYQNDEGRSVRLRDNQRLPIRPFGPSLNDYGISRHPRPAFYGESRPHRLDFYPRQPEPFGNRPPRLPHPMHMSPGPRPNGAVRGVNVYVSNMPNASPDVVFDLFRPYGPFPGSLRLRRDPQGHPMGEAVVSLPSPAEAERAIHDLNGYRLYGRNLVLRFDGETPRSE